MSHHPSSEYEDAQRPQQSLQYWLTQGDNFVEQKCFQEALLAYEQAIQLDPQNARVYRANGIALDGLKRHKEALLLYDRAISLDPNNPITHAA